MLARMKEQQAHQVAHVAAITDFYAVLTPEQKKTFDEFHSAPMAGKHGKARRHAADADKAAEVARGAKGATSVKNDMIIKGQQ